MCIQICKDYDKIKLVIVLISLKILYEMRRDIYVVDRFNLSKVLNEMRYEIEI